MVAAISTTISRIQWLSREAWPITLLWRSMIRESSATQPATSESASRMVPAAQSAVANCPGTSARRRRTSTRLVSERDAPTLSIGAQGVNSVRGRTIVIPSHSPGMTDTNAPLPGRQGGTSRPRDRAGFLRRVLDTLIPGREARRRYQTLVQELSDAVWEMDPALTRVLFVSDRLTDLVGRSPREMEADRAMWLRDVVHPDDRQAFLDFMTLLRQHGWAEIEYRACHADGREVWLRTRAHRVYDDRGKPRAVNGVTADITAQRAAQSELLASEQQYRLLAEGLPVIPYRDALDGSQALYVGPRIEPLLGYTPQQWLAGGLEWWFRLVHPDDLMRVARATEESIEHQSPLSVRYRVRHAEAGWRWFEDEAIVVQGEDGEPLYRQGVLRDITAEELATRAQGEAEQRFRTMVEQLPMAVYIDQPDDTFTNVYISPQIERMLGYPVDQWMGNPEMFQSVLHPDDRERVLAEQREWLERGGEYRGEYRLVTRGRRGRVDPRGVDRRRRRGRPGDVHAGLPGGRHRAAGR